ncbi:Catabolite control protein A [Pseudovibrio sp. W64]|uniref:substrate-binding domain-containing protein n=1 Tax=unclassified Pseudovibrio TaxID=2627060 RepID=UPI0007B1916D|nr:MULTISPECIES: substrate-binding domain-containing protein [unclassified Pseudovibrio]KZK79356.1 Catabolite control protein A [Pseudovibrio sp. W64]KZK94535.1 Catabolite control protein A [Pseudovibrio sp. W74]KZL06934.1 Catabolite control protein A [Pseudovibrio sp. Ad14]
MKSDHEWERSDDNLLGGNSVSITDQNVQQRKSVTIGDVARHVGVAKGTVSRVLNNYTDISKATRERVLKAVEELGYRPSSTARNLKRGRVDTFGIVLPLMPGKGADPFLAEFLDGMTRALNAVDKDLLVTTASSMDDAVLAIRRLISSQKVDGFVLTRTATNDPRVDYLLDRGFPFVSHGRTAREGEHPWFDIDNHAAFYSAARKVIAQGHTRIALVMSNPQMNFSRLRIEGFQQGLEEAGLSFEEQLIVETSLDEPGGEQAALQLLHQDRPPTAIICMTDAIAIGVTKIIRRHGLTIGEDVTVIGYDGLPVCEHFDPPLTSFAQEPVLAGSTLAELLTKAISGQPARELQVLAEARLIQRGSDGPPRKTPEELKAHLSAYFATA